MKNLDELTALCKKLGADPVQAETMARQLMKRSLQIAEKRNIDQIQAMDYLLKVIVHGRMGDVFKEAS